MPAQVYRAMIAVHILETDFQLSESQRWAFSPCERICQIRQKQVEFEAFYCRTQPAGPMMMMVYTEIQKKYKSITNSQNLELIELY